MSLSLSARWFALVLGLLVCACAPVSQSPLRPSPQFTGPRLDKDRFISFDGAPLPLARWAPSAEEPWAVVVGLHGMNDHAQAFWMLGPWLAERGVATYAYDQRGFGGAPRRGVWGNDRLMAEDLRVICALVRARHPHALIAVAGESMGGAVALNAMGSDRPPDADRLILIAPAVWGWSSQPLLYRLALWFGARLAGDRPLDPPAFVTRKIAASDNLSELRRMGRDPDMIGSTRPDALYGLVNLMSRAERAAGRVGTPTLYLYGAHDQIIPPQPSRRAAGRLKPTDRTVFYPDGWHLLIRDHEATAVYADILAFLKDPAAAPPSGQGPIR